MSTFDAENQVRFSKENRPFVSVSMNGQRCPATKDVIASIAKHNSCSRQARLARGRSDARARSERQALAVVVRNRDERVHRMSVPQMQEAARLGAFVEFVGGNIGDADGKARMDRFAGRDQKDRSAVLHSVVGPRQKGNPLPTDGFAEFLGAMKAHV
jgi:hypothetical protein